MEKFWSKDLDEIFWIKRPEKLLDKSNPPFIKYFPNGKLNLCYNTLTRYIKNNNGDIKTIIWKNGYGKKIEILTYNDFIEK